MTVLSLGYQSFLLPDGVDAAPVLELLSKSLPCRYYEFDKFKCTLEDGEVEMKIRVVPKKCRFVRKMGEVEVDAFAPAQKPKARTAKTLAMPPPEPMMIANGNDQRSLPASQGTLFLEGPGK